MCRGLLMKRWKMDYNIKIKQKQKKKKKKQAKKVGEKMEQTSKNPKVNKYEVLL